jgi:uncharacterized integral membrane protein|uniref:Uncharacterized protein n=1 Tax=viral metagenome TaxID=1070528 RepID=A0A6C0F5N3_9ZZZZ
MGQCECAKEENKIIKVDNQTNNKIFIALIIIIILLLIYVVNKKC